MTNTNHDTLYRKYRPASFDQVRGQDSIVSALKGAIKNKRVSHAYLFAGGRGTGKTSIARILAKELGVHEKDIYEIDAASYTGVDNIRELREGVYSLPFHSPYKIYIIDEAHMLSKAAFNALLKTLEEPPQHVIFVLATTERDKIIDTIQSRCEVYSFAEPTNDIIAGVVSSVAEEEKYTLTKDASALISSLADGSFRDALSILQKVLASADGNSVDVSCVERIMATPKSELTLNVVLAIANHDASSALSILQTAWLSSIEPKVMTKLIISRMREVMLLRYAPKTFEKIIDIRKDDAETIKLLIKNPNINSDALRILLEAYATMTYAAVPTLPLEIAVMDICAAD